MEGIYHEQPLLDGWGNSGPFYDHRFMGLDRAPYRSLYFPAQPLGPYMRHMEPALQEGLEDLPYDGPIPDDGLSSEDEDDDDDDELAIYSHVDLQKIQGKQIAVWCHRSPDTLAIFTPIPGDTLATAVSFARSTLHCDPSVDRVLLLVPGQRRPVDPAALRAAQPGSSLLVVPKYDYVVTLEVTQLNLKLQMVVSITMTVRHLKATLQRDRGFPVERTDLLFRDQPMENQRHLFDYHITHGATIFIMLHLVYDVQITVETFWGQNYEMYVDPCMTTANLLNTVLRRTISPQAGEVSSYFHLILPRHALVMYSPDGAAMKWNGCLGLYGAEDGAVFSLATIALAHQMSIQSIPVLIETGKTHKFRVSKFDYWSVLALKLHGLLGYPVNLMRLFHRKRELDLARAVGSYSHKTPPVSLNMSLLKLDKDVYGGVSLNFRLGNGVAEVLICSPSRTVKSVKAMLEEIGVPNATTYDFYIDGYRLPNNGRVGDVVEEYKKPIDLKLRHYPLFVHGPKSVIYKMNVHAQEALKVFKGRVELKTGLSQSDYYMLMSGLPISDSDSNPVFQTPLAIGSSVFLMALQQHQTFFVVWDDWLVKLRLPFQPQPSEIKEILRKDRNIPEGSLASVGNFLQWYYAMRATNKGLLYDYIKNAQQQLQEVTLRQSRPRKRREQAEAILWKDNYKQMQQLQHALEDRYREKAEPDRPTVPVLALPTSVRKTPKARKTRTTRKGDYPRRTEPTVKGEKSGLYYAARRNGEWERVNPEDLVESYLRAWSLPPDPAHRARSTHYGHLRKHHSAMPDFHTRKRDGQSVRKDPEWVYNLKQMARDERVEPAHVGFLKKKRRKKRYAR